MVKNLFDMNKHSFDDLKKTLVSEIGLKMMKNC